MIKKEKISKDNIVNFPSKLTEIEKEIEAVIFAAAEPLMLILLKVKFQKNQMLQNFRKITTRIFKSRN